jgi:formylglycine-generating enzyme required for sulfatase activity
MIEYEDFSLKIEPKQGEVYPVFVLRSPAGEGRSSFRLPFDLDEAGDILFDLGQTVRRSGQASPAATRTPPQQVGHQLFQALFSGRVRSLLDQSLGMIHGRERGLRIKLHIDPEDPSLAQLASLPWEFLYRQGTRDFLNLSISTPVVRYLDVQRPYTPLPLKPPLRILVVISSPADYPPLDLDRERGLIEGSWARLGDVRVEISERAHILALQDRLAERPYQVLHYMGHGDFDARTGQGGLVMEDEGGDGYVVDGSALGVLLRDVPTMRLVFLNACETARVTKERGLDPFAGVATAIVMAGIPAVVAMQFPISDRAAITFARRFYPLLARGYTVDAAVAEGRRAIYLAEGGTMEWGTPVLFMRSPQGVIFRVAGARAEPPPKTLKAPPEVDEALERRLAGLYTDGSSAFWTEDWEQACRSFQAIVDQRPDYRDAAARLENAKRKRKLSALYAQAQAAREAEDWPAAVSALEELVAVGPGYKDAAAVLETVKKQKQLPDLYAEARQLHGAGQWLAVIKVLERIETLDPAYPDPDELLASARAGLEAEERARKLEALYSRGLQHMDAGEWSQALERLEEVQQLESGYRDMEALLARARRELAELLHPSLVLKLSVNPQKVEVGDEAKWTATLRNDGDDDLRRVTVKHGQTPLDEAFDLAAGKGRHFTFTTTYETKGKRTEKVAATGVASNGQSVHDQASATVQVREPKAGPDVLTITSPIHLELVRVPAGEFLMGSDPAKDEYADDNEQPQHRVTLSEFYIGKYPVTNEHYAAFVKAAKHRAPEHWKKGKIPSGKENHPVVDVSWEDAIAFCQWLSGETSKPFRLPTEAEWEKAARGTDGRIYPWGNEWDRARSNYYGGKPGKVLLSVLSSSVVGPTPVGQYSPQGDSPYGAADMSGNVREWCADWYDENEYQRRMRSAVKDPQGPTKGSTRVWRGGSFFDLQVVVRCACRGEGSPDVRLDIYGFRLVVAPGF